MIAINPAVNVRKINRKDTIISISLALYVLFSYMINIPEIIILGSVVLYLFLGLTLVKLITKQTPIKISFYSVWYLAFGILGALSFFYALNTGYVIGDLYLLFVSLVLTFSFIQYLRNNTSIVRIFSFYAYSPIILVLYLFISGEISPHGERLGETTFGNANNLAIVMMISIYCISWFIIYGKKKYYLINIILLIIYFYVIAMSGGRKYFLLPFIFIAIMFLLKNGLKKILPSMLFLILILIIGSATIWSVINVPLLYNSIGVRFEGLLSFFSGDQRNIDDSTLIRFMMIENGWKWFLQQPLIGFGLNNYRVLLNEILGLNYAHNNFIELMVDLGMVGLLIYYSFYAFLIGKLAQIRNDITGIRDFFLAFMITLLIFEIGSVTYNLYVVQIFIGLAAAYAWLYSKWMREYNNGQIVNPIR